MRIAGFVSIAVALCAMPVRAQSSDSTASPGTENSALNIWVSAGVGAGTNGFGSVASGWVSGGKWIVGFRNASASGFYGTETHDRALMLGVRSHSGHLQSFVAAGPGRIGGARSNGEQSGTTSPYANEASVGFAAEAGWTSTLIGIGLSAFGAKGASLSFKGMALAVQLGWLR